MGRTSAIYTTPRTDPRDITEILIPLSWFGRHSFMSPGQALSLYLIEEVRLSFTDAAGLIGKDETTVRISYSKAAEKRDTHRAREARKKRQQKQPAEIK